jgi:hypothetical protein
MSIQELTERLAQIKEDIGVRDKVRKDFERVRASLSAERARLRSLAEILRKETSDVERLEGLSVEGLFYQILGSKEQQLDKEIQEQLAAKLKHDQCRHAITAMEQEFAEIEQRMPKSQDLDAQYESLLKDKEKLLLEKNSDETRELIALAEKTGTLQASLKELREATLAGESVRHSLDRVLESLSSARNWGTWDMFGGGMLSTHIKHSRIDDARGHVHDAQVQAARFERELADVDLKVDVAIQFSSFSKFADYFFDNLITDWIVNSRIDESRSSASAARARVDMVLAQLRQRVSQEQHQISEAVAQRRSTIERA